MKDDAKWIELQRLLYKMETHPDIIEGQSWHSLLFRAQLAQDLWHHHVAPKLTSSSGDDEDDFSQYDQLAQRVDQACRRAQELANQYEQQQQQQSQQLSREFGEEDGVSSNNNNDAEIDAVIDSLFFSQEKETQEEGSQEDGGDGDDFSDDNIVEEEEEEEEESSSSSQQRHESEMNSPPSHKHSHHNRHHQSKNASSLEELQQAQREQMEEAISLMAKQMKDATKGIQASIQQHTHSILDELETVAEQNVQDVTQVTQNVQTHNTNRSRTNFGTWTMLFVIIGTFVFLLITIFTIPKSQNACFGPCGKFKFVSKGVSLSKSIISKSYTKSIQLYKLMTDPNYDEGEYDDEYNNEEEQMESWEEELYEEDEVEKQQKEQLDKLIKAMQNKEKEEKVAATEAKAKIPDWREAMNEDDTEEEGGEEEEDDIDVDNPWGQKPVNVIQKQEKYRDGKEDNPIANEIHEGRAAEDETKVSGEEETNIDKDGTKPQSPLKEESSIQDRRDGPNDAKVEDSSSTTIAADENNIDERCVDTDDNCNYHQDDVDMDSLMASLKQHAQQKDTILAQEQQEHAKQQQQQEGESSKFSGTTATSTDDSYFESASSNNIPNRVGLENDEGADAFEREGVAKARVSPRDLRLAAANGNLDKLKEYIDLHPEYVNRHDKHGWTSLHMAARAGKVSIITLLIDNGADMHLQTTDGKYSYQIAAEIYGRESNIVKMLRPEGVIDADDFRHAVLAGDAKKIREYTKLRPELLNLQDQNGWSPLAEAARVGNMSVVKALVQLGASKTSLTKKGQTPFDIATANFGRGHAVSYLLRPKGYIDDIDLRLAAGQKNAKKVQEYLDGGLDVNKQDNNGWASIHEAARVGSVPVLQILLDYGADKGRKTSAGETAYHIAAKNYGMDHEATRMLRPAVMSDDDVALIEQIKETRHEGKRNRNIGSDEL